MRVGFEACQMLSRDAVVATGLRTQRAYAWTDGPTLAAEFETVPRGANVSFAQLLPEAPTPGAIQVRNERANRFLNRRWPYLVRLSGFLEIDSRSSLPESLLDTLNRLRLLLWDPNSVDYPSDQRTRLPGYRREFSHSQIFDITRERRPSDAMTFAATNPDEPTGPGYATILDTPRFDRHNELVWSPILPMRDRTTVDADADRISATLRALRLQYNSDDELEDAFEHAARGDYKAATRSGASAAEAMVKFCGKKWQVDFPGGNDSFNKKVDRLLSSSGFDTWSSVDAAGSEHLRCLYQARNKMHEGDCYYSSPTGDRVEVTHIGQVDPWLASVERFMVWIESLA